MRKMKTDWKQRSKLYNQLDWPNRNELLDAVVEMAGDLQANKKVLDIGTGTGKVLKVLKKEFSEVDYYGLDISQSMLDKIDSRYGFRLIPGDMQNMLCFTDETFDLVTARMVLHHADNLDRAVSEVYRALKKGGKFIVCEGHPPTSSVKSFFEKMFKLKEDRITFMPHDLVNLLSGYNFQSITSRTIILRNMSLNNWLDNSEIPRRNKEMIRKMHHDCDDFVKKAYNMKFVDGDILMDWKFSVLAGIK